MPDDRPILFEQQTDPDANRMAAFGAADPGDRAAFDAKWVRIRANSSSIRSIVVDGAAADHALAGSISVWRDPDMPGPEVSYWLGRAFWGRGIATAALRLFLADISTRPLYGRAAADNAGSIRVLEHCGFVRIGTDQGWSSARSQTVSELILRLEA